MQKILITGGFGYIGSKLILHLKNKYKFIILEHPNATKPKFLKNVKVIRADITKSSQIKKLRIKNISVVLHLAAQSSGPKSFSIPVEDVKKNLIGTINTINLCKAVLLFIIYILNHLLSCRYDILEEFRFP